MLPARGMIDWLSMTVRKARAAFAALLARCAQTQNKTQNQTQYQTQNKKSPR
jgi:predicted Fe-S protein YdhL (DUF1289 family)